MDASNYVSQANHGLNLFREMKEWFLGFADQRIASSSIKSSIM